MPSPSPAQSARDSGRAPVAGRRRSHADAPARGWRAGVVAGAAMLLALLAGGCAGGGDGPTGPTDGGTPPVTPGEPAPPPPPPPARAALTVTIGGLPTALDADVTVSGPGGARRLGATQRLSELEPGSYTITAADVTQGGVTWRATPGSQTRTLSAGEDGSATVSYTPAGATLVLAATGLPSYARAPLRLTLADGTERVAVSGDTVRGLPAGAVRLQADPVNTTDGRFEAVPSVRNDTLVEGAVRTVTFSYGIVRASLAITVEGLPAGAPAGLVVGGPDGYRAVVDSTTTLEGLLPGRYQADAVRVRHAGFSWDASPRSEAVTLGATDRRAFAFRYAIATGAIAVSIAGLPDDVDGAVRIRAPGGSETLLTATATLTDLAPGAYVVTADPVVVDGATYSPANTGDTVLVTASLVATPVAVTYARRSGALRLTSTGLPAAGPAPRLRVQGPDGFDELVTAKDAVLPIGRAGSYTVTADTVTDGADRWAPTPRTQTATIALGDTAAVVVAHQRATAHLVLTVVGLDAGVDAAILVTGPGGFAAIRTASDTLTGLQPGGYTVTASAVSSGSTTWTPSPATRAVTLVAGGTADATVAYAANSTGLAVLIEGLPSGSAGAVTVTGPGGFTQSLTGSASLAALAPGSYTITAAPISALGHGWSATPASQSVTLVAGQSLVRTVTYALATGAIAVASSGLPPGENAAITVTGPGGYSRALVGTETLTGLVPGAYTVSASAVSIGGTSYTPAPGTQGVTVGASLVAQPATITWTAGGGGTEPNLVLEGAYLVQAIQRLDGTVPIVAGREALLRVFVTSPSANTLSPSVRVRLYDNGSEFRSFTIAAPGAGVPSSVSDASLGGSWNAVLPASDVRTNLAIRVDVDPGDAVDEPDETDNVWPRSGTRAIDVRDVPPLDLMFVPVRQSANGLTGNVTTANADNLLSMTRRIWPLRDIAVSVRDTYTTTVPALQSNDANGAWLDLLSELNTLRMTEASGGRFYAGVVGTTYGSGIAGYAYVPGRTSVQWDKSGSVSRVLAHELGHNFSRMHAPACAPPSTDPSYPHAGGIIGHTGWDEGSGAVVPSTRTDVMGYCSNQWVSDFSWERVFTYRAGAGASALAFDASPQRVLVVWGTIRDGRVRLEPAYVTTARPSVPAGGDHRLELRDRNGAVLGSWRFAGDVVDHAGTARTFTLALPLADAVHARLDRIVVTAPGVLGSAERQARRAAQAPPTAGGAGVTQGRELLSADAGAGLELVDPAARVTRTGAAVTVAWDADAYAMGIVRDAERDVVLAVLRRPGDAITVGARTRLRITFSDGVHSVTRTLPVR